MKNNFLKRHSSTILTCIGAVGVVVTAVAAAKATPKAMLLLEMAKDEKKEELTKLEKVKVAAPAYIPSMIIGASTIACIFGANALNKHQQAALTSAYALLDSSYKEYRRKVKEIYGEEGHKQIVDGMASDRQDDVVKLPEGEVQIFDFFSLQLFNASLDDIKAAEYYINDLLLTRGYVSLAEFYEYLGIPCGIMDYEMGWSIGAGYAYGYDHVEFIVEKMTDSDNNDRYILTMSADPSTNYV